MMNTTYLEPRLQKLIDLGETGTNILHGELKNLMLEAEQQYEEAKQIEEDNDYSDAAIQILYPAHLYPYIGAQAPKKPPTFSPPRA